MTLATLTPHLPALLAGAGIAVALGLAAARWLGPRGFMDIPRGRHAHERPVPRTGGLVLIATLALGWFLGYRRLAFTPEQWVGLAAFAAVGLVDDLRGLRARHKALAGLLIAAAIAVPAALRVVAAQPHVEVLGVIQLPPVFPVAWLLVFLLYAFVPQALNLIDGANGLAIGYALIVVGVLAALGQPFGFCAGALMGLLALNWPRARHFLGDTGALTLGLLLAIEVKRHVGVADPDLVLWMFAYPIVDVVLVVVLRLGRGRPLGQGDRSHLHHQWMDRFPAHRAKVVPLLWLQAGLCASAPLVQGWLWLLPVLGLSLLAGQAVVFLLQGLTAERERPVLELEPLRLDEDTREFGGPVRDSGDGRQA